jgi:DNA-directed RNA polymerase subunit RPC12/RpoP
MGEETPTHPDTGWRVTDYFCPHCGKQEVENEDSYPDYYLGTSYRCRSCKAEFYLDNGKPPPEGKK